MFFSLKIGQSLHQLPVWLASPEHESKGLGEIHIKRGGGLGPCSLTNSSEGSRDVQASSPRVPSREGSESQGPRPSRVQAWVGSVRFVSPRFHLRMVPAWASSWAPHRGFLVRLSREADGRGTCICLPWGLTRGRYSTVTHSVYHRPSLHRLPFERGLQWATTAFQKNLSQACDC